MIEPNLKVAIITTLDQQHAKNALSLALGGGLRSVVVYTELPQDPRARIHLFPTDEALGSLVKKILIGARSSGELLGINGYIFNVAFGFPNRQGRQVADADQIIGYFRDTVNKRLSQSFISRI